VLFRSLYPDGFLFVKKKALAFSPGWGYKTTSLMPGSPVSGPARRFRAMTELVHSRRFPHVPDVRYMRQAPQLRQ
jgi:hypothetical protein